jgi:YidC/Oxa1 family membrane protein insertase
MEEKKLDLNSIIGFALIFGILIWIMYQNQPSEKEIAAEKAKKELVKKQAAEKAKVATVQANSMLSAVKDSTQISALKATLGNFAYSATLPAAKLNFTTIENKLVILKIANKGGFIVSAKLKNFEKFKKGSGELVELIKDNNSNLNLNFLLTRVYIHLLT